ncbi:sulfite exporter TauE/SafE family protein [Ancrocorticia populi]|uniref:Probable membrane transporter protein n=1 Tax=Ancrocorticia populi TaxID=2175228 RepID=A0A2V1K6G5_9ACTO|nr:sulfite exporter TauE/SafE family protein [Ancrocorticia populi]PWF27048.1 sulfite exporter TauE/SafE family protein [Ancrocorticia populi]
MSQNTPAERRWLAIILIGLATGYLSGIFAVGGGVIMVPALVAFAKFDQKLASGTSLAAMVFPASVGVITYVVHDSVDWAAVGLLIIGSITGAQIGSYLLSRLSSRTAQWAFVGFLAISIISMVIVIPERGSSIDITVLTAIALVGVGLLTGTLAGLVGVGGGVILVPAMIVGFGASDLIAKGTSLAVIIPTSLSGTIGNLRRKNVDLKAALVLGVAACLTSPLGVMSAVAIPPQTSNYLFAAFQAFVGGRMALQLIRTRGQAR